jgi:ABC-2 type transport system ATP-binding protein
MPDAVISVHGLSKSYGDVKAVQGIDLEVRAGEIFAFLGPNGAGKTTTVEILEGFRRRDAGHAQVLGVDPAGADRAWRERVGFVLQQSKPDAYLTARESLGLYAGYYSSPRPIEETIELIGLTEAADQRAQKLSGGQQRRLDVGMALIGDPELLFLDEPTTGFDPSARRRFWAVIESLSELGKTIFLTTHYMEEAQALADRVAIIARGRIVAEGAPEQLGDRQSAPATISFRLPPGARPADLPGEAAGAAAKNGSVSFRTRSAVRALNELTEWALGRGVDLEGLEVRRPTLEDVYMELTRGTDDDLADGAAAAEPRSASTGAEP